MHLEEIRALEKRYVMQTYGRNEIALVSGEGARLRDSEGKEYIDLTSGIGVDPQKRSDYVRALQEKGVLVLTAGEDTIRLLPPLVITKEDIDQALACMKEVLK